MLRAFPAFAWMASGIWHLFAPSACSGLGDQLTDIWLRLRLRLRPLTAQHAEPLALAAGAPPTLSARSAHFCFINSSTSLSTPSGHATFCCKPGARSCPLTPLFSASALWPIMSLISDEGFDFFFSRIDLDVSSGQVWSVAAGRILPHSPASATRGGLTDGPFANS